MRRSLQWLTVGLLSLGLGLHWAALQTVAWTAMVVERVQTMSFAEAVGTTLDGGHPCRLCLAVREGRRAESEGQREAGGGVVARKLDPGLRVDPEPVRRLAGDEGDVRDSVFPPVGALRPRFEPPFLRPPRAA